MIFYISGLNDYRTRCKNIVYVNIILINQLLFCEKTVEYSLSDAGIMFSWDLESCTPKMLRTFILLGIFFGCLPSTSLPLPLEAAFQGSLTLFL